MIQRYEQYCVLRRVALSIQSRNGDRLHGKKGGQAPGDIAWFWRPYDLLRCCGSGEYLHCIRNDEPISNSLSLFFTIFLSFSLTVETSTMLHWRGGE